MVDGEMQRVYTRAVIGVSVAVCVRACSGIGCAIPYITITDGSSIAIVRGVINSEI